MPRIGSIALVALPREYEHEWHLHEQRSLQSKQGNQYPATPVAIDIGKLMMMHLDNI